MKRLFGLCLLALLTTITLAACSTQKSSGISDPNEVESAGDAAPARSREAAVSQEEPNPEGEIDLEPGALALGGDAGLVEERAQIEAQMAAIEERIENDMDPWAAARQMDTDEIVGLGELRSYLETIVEMTYQTHGTRRIKNPRIWSLHDLDIIAEHLAR